MKPEQMQQTQLKHISAESVHAEETDQCLRKLGKPYTHMVLGWSFGLREL